MVKVLLLTCRAAIVGNMALMDAMDKINRKLGSGMTGLAAGGFQATPKWGMRQLQISPHYTSRISDVPRATC